MRTTIWRLDVGNRVGQEEAQKKWEEGLAYIEKLKQEDEVISVEETEKAFIITLK